MPASLQNWLDHVFVDASDQNACGSLQNWLDKTIMASPNDRDIESLVSAAGSMKLIVRPDKGGHAGRPIQLQANHFRFTLGKRIVVKQYDVDIARFDADWKPKKTSRNESHQLFWTAVKANASVFGDPEQIVYDCRKTMFAVKSIDHCISGKPLILQFQSILAGDRERDITCRLKIQYACDVDMGDIRRMYHEELDERETSQIRFLDLLFRQGRHFNDTLVPAGRSFYFRSHDRDCLDLGCGRELLKGFYLSSRIIDNWQLSLNINLNATAFYETDNLIDFAAKFLCYQLKREYSPKMAIPTTLPERERKLLEKELVGSPPPAIKLFSVLMNHTVTPTAVSNMTARTYKFRWMDKDGDHGDVAVVDYFKMRHGVELKYPDWPLLVRGKGKNQSYHPMEVLSIAPGQRVKNRKIDENQRAAIIKRTAVTPFQRRQNILDMLKQARIAEDPRLRKFYVSISMEMAQLCGRVLAPPALQCNKNSNDVVQPVSGCWMTNGLYDGATLSGWGLASFSNINDNDILEFARALHDEACRMGVKVQAPCTRIWRGADVAGVASVLGQVTDAFASRKLPLQLIVVVMNGRNNELYAEIKRVGESVLGVMTQCVQSDRVRQVNPRAPDGGRKGRQSLTNIVLKINAKLGGINVQIHSSDVIAQKYLFTPILFIGADVNHPEPGDSKSPSVAAVCSNIDCHPNRYVGIEMLQRSRVEILSDLKRAVKHSLCSYYRNTGGLKPDKIIFYRDGVSEGQFGEVLTKEVMVIQNACLEMQDDYKPAITFIVVQKRHNTRFFKKQINERDRPADQNIPAGTVVDSVVTHPAEFDFFLCSHQGIQGTSKPTHYHVLFDQTGFTSDELQALTYRLCHTYARCSRSVSIPAPCYYAHLIAYRAKLRLHCQVGSETNSGESFSDDSGLTDDDLIRLQNLIALNDDMKDTMYWQ